MSTTMTISEAEKIIDIVSKALQDTNHRHSPVSLLKGYDIYQICTALNLRIANELLLLTAREDFEEQFANRLNLYGGIPWQIMWFVPDEQVDSLHPRMVFDLFIDRATMKVKGTRWAAQESASSFGDFCKGIGSGDPDYWKKIYARLGLEYGSGSPEGNGPVKSST